MQNASRLLSGRDAFLHLALTPDFLHFALRLSLNVTEAAQPLERFLVERRSL
jgi:hypothetical protein